MSESSKDKLLITGATGFVGSGLFRDLGKSYETLGTSHSSPSSENLVQLDVTNKAAVEELIKTSRPTVIIHAAGSGSLKWCEEHPKEARKLNEEGTRNIIEAANKVGAGVILISSFAAINPNNVYASTKASSERMIKNLAKSWVIIRPTVVFGLSPNTTNDKFMNRILKNITDKTDPVYNNTWQIQPTDLGHLSEVISAVIDKRLTKETIPVVTEKLATYFDIARDVLIHFGIHAIPIEGHFYPPEKDDRSKLKKLGLPLVEYNQMIQRCVSAIKSTHPKTSP